MRGNRWLYFSHSEQYCLLGVRLHLLDVSSNVYCTCFVPGDVDPDLDAHFDSNIDSDLHTDADNHSGPMHGYGFAERIRTVFQDLLQPVQERNMHGWGNMQRRGVY